MTGDRVASAVITYAAALMRTGEIDVVELPIRREDGSAARSTMLLGPVTQLSTESLAQHAGWDELEDDELVEQLKVRTKYLMDPHPPSYEAHPVHVVEDLDI
jgi:hypothetical protein